MKKHMFLVRWYREGRIVTPVLDMHMSCVWPLGPEDKDPIAARALLSMVGGTANLPDEVKKFLDAYKGMSLRMRYNSDDMQGPYLVDDYEGTYTRETLVDWLRTVSDKDLERYHVGARKRRFG